MPDTRLSMMNVRRALGVLAALALLTLGCEASQDRTAPDGADSIRLRSDGEMLGDRSGEIQEALLVEDALGRAERLAAILQTLEPEALEDAKAAYDSVYLDIGDFELEMLADWWARFDPEAALAWARSDWRAAHMGVLEAVLRAWARIDPQAALAEAESENRPIQQVTLVSAVLRGWEEGGHPGALDFAMTLPGEYGMRVNAVMIRRRVMRTGADATIEWFESLPGVMDGTKKDIQKRVATAVADVAPEKAAAWVEPYMAKRDRTRLAHRVGARWARQDPEAAMAWLESLPESMDRDFGVKETYRAWFRHDRERAWAWLVEQEPEPWLDEALAMYAQSWQRVHPKDGGTALAKALEIADEELRWTTVMNTWKAWLRADAKPAAEWFAARFDEIPEFYRERMQVVPAGTVQKWSGEEKAAAQ
jgi:hypothetical protein